MRLASLTILLILLSILLVNPLIAEEKEELWLTNLEAGLERSTEQDKPVLLYFTGSDWCGWCIKLTEEVLDTDQFISYAKENLILVKLDFPRSIQQDEETVRYNRSIMERFNVRGFPTLFILGSDGSVIAQTGYRQGGAERYIEHLENLMR
jgi:protein disulfide-isomerase